MQMTDDACMQMMVVSNGADGTVHCNAFDIAWSDKDNGVHSGDAGD